MSEAGKSDYDRSVCTWSPAGRLFQLEYAMEAIKFGTTAIGVRCKEGVILVVEKKLPNTLIVPSSMEKIFEIDHHIACATSGLLADARTLVDHARNEAQNHWFTYNEKFSVESSVHSIADLALDFADVGEGKRKKTMSRPFGVAMLVGGISNAGEPELWMMTPTGVCTQYTAAAIGSAQEGATSLLKEQFAPETMTLQEAEACAVGILRQMMEERMTTVTVEVASIRQDTGKYHVYTTAEIEAIINRLPAPLEY